MKTIFDLQNYSEPLQSKKLVCYLLQEVNTGNKQGRNTGLKQHAI